MTALQYDWATVNVLWRRDLKRFWRQPSRLVGALGQPIIFWFVIGTGMAATFRMPGNNVSYLEYFFPGVILMVALFASIFASVSVIDDRHAGFLQAVMAGPGSSFALALGKCLGSASVALVQIVCFMALAPVAGFDFAAVNWPLFASALLLATMGLSALGFAVAWWLDNVQAYHAIQMTLLVPLWVVSGAMFPVQAEQTVYSWVLALNPPAYAVAAVRQALYGSAHEALPLTLNPALSLPVLTVFAVLAMACATYACRRERTTS